MLKDRQSEGNICSEQKMRAEYALQASPRTRSIKVLELALGELQGTKHWEWDKEGVQIMQDPDQRGSHKSDLCGLEQYEKH